MLHTAGLPFQLTQSRGGCGLTKQFHWRSVHCPPSHPHLYGGGSTGGGFCCPVESPDREHCPGSAECCLSPIPGAPGCEGVARCGTNPTNKPACPPPKKLTRRVPLTRQGLPPPPPGAERCSVPADSPLTKFNESAMVDSTKGWRGCDDYVGWGRILGKLAQQFPQLVALNIDDFSSNVPRIFNEITVPEIRKGLDGRVSLIPTHYYGGSKPGDFVLHRYPWLAHGPSSTDGALFYFRNDKEGQQQCGHPSASNHGLCTPPNRSEITVTHNDSDPIPCTSCCLSGKRAEISLANIGSEIDDFAKALPADHPLHIGLYFSGYSHCATPSPDYDREALIAALSNPAVSGEVFFKTCLSAVRSGIFAYYP